jgi:protein Mpv17
MCRELMKKHILLFNTGTCTTLYVAGDLIQQRIEGSKSVDWDRTLHMATLGLCMGLFQHGWYTQLDRVLVGTSWKIVFKKVLADQLVMAPICCSVFYLGELG